MANMLSATSCLRQQIFLRPRGTARRAPVPFSTRYRPHKYETYQIDSGMDTEEIKNDPGARQPRRGSRRCLRRLVALLRLLQVHLRVHQQPGQGFDLQTPGAALRSAARGAGGQPWELMWFRLLFAGQVSSLNLVFYLRAPATAL